MDNNFIAVLPLICIVSFVLIAFITSFFLTRAAASGHDTNWPDGEAEGETASAH